MRPEAAARGPSPDSAEAACSLPLKIEESPSRGRSRARRAKLSDLPLKALRVPSDMNATVALLEVEGEAAPCAEKLTAINESLQGRERLLTATARASRLLLEAAEVRGAIPRVLGLIGEAAHVDRVNVLEARVGPMGEPLLVMTSEWTAEGVTPHLQEARSFSCDERNFSSVCAELRAGRSVCLSPAEIHAEQGCSGIEGIGTRTKAIVPIFVASEFIGVVSFDNTRQRRAIDAAELAALETAAGVIGAALHRERLVDDVRRERERAAEERVTELAKANAVIRGNLERLAGQTDLHSFMGHMLLEATRQFEAISGAVIVLKDSLQEWRVVAHVREGQLAQPSFAVSVPVNGSPFTAQFGDLRGPLYLNIDRVDSDIWPGVLAFYRSEGAVGTVIYPLVFGARSVGFLVLTFQRHAEDVQKSELLVALAQQATLAVQLTRLAYSAKEAAVLMERTRIGQEIHDGLAFPSCRKRGSELGLTLSRVRELARDGLAEARRSVMALRLDQTRRAGLEIALRQLADRSTVAGGITCTFEGGGISTGLRPEHEHELLRIAQEAVSNAVRHARPHHVHITMTDQDADWELAVADDGVGMEQRPDVYAREGFGLSSMRQRAGAIGGDWRIESTPGAGTRVSVRMLKRAS
ncbi:MAG: GAF domain-containing sensor histidine kinase [Gammaproteobacteria bacterium]|nr:MAG: GAF domain-containing sensor histidine kinase [Gammaproteobacteria bacterium]